MYQCYLIGSHTEYWCTVWQSSGYDPGLSRVNTAGQWCAKGRTLIAITNAKCKTENLNQVTTINWPN